MREILFRGMDKTGGWIYGDLIRIPRDSGTHNEPPSLELETCITDNKILSRNPIEVMFETVGQYIGHKDKNEKKIFEGDIGKNTTEIFEIYYDKDTCSFRWRNTRWNIGLRSDVINLEIIGNVFENIELIGGE